MTAALRQDGEEPVHLFLRRGHAAPDHECTQADTAQPGLYPTIDRGNVNAATAPVPRQELGQARQKNNLLSCPPGCTVSSASHHAPAIPHATQREEPPSRSRYHLLSCYFRTKARHSLPRPVSCQRKSFPSFPT
jgi:hypothetical protein